MTEYNFKWLERENESNEVREERLDMAGRIVILEFKDPDAANSFVENDTMASQLGYTRLAVYVRPTKFCECPDKQRQNGKNWRKGKRTGLYLCIKCKRPSVHHQRGILSRLQYVFGFNQLTIEDEN